MRLHTLAKPAVTHALLAVAFACCMTLGCQGDGSFFFAIVDGGTTARDASPDGTGGTGAIGGSGGAMSIDAGDSDGGATDSGTSSWTSPFPNTGAPGWRDSTTSLCGVVGPGQHAWGIDLWSDAQNLYAVVIGDVDPSLDSTDHPGRCAGQCAWLSLYRNDGQTWTRALNQAAPARAAFDEDMVPSIRGVVQGPLFLHRVNVPTADSWPCRLATLIGGDTTCGSSGEPIHALSVTSEGRAYAMGNDTSFLIWNGTAWQADPRSPTFAPQDLWANNQDVIVVGAEHIGRLTGAGWDEETLPFFGATALWGTSREDLWVGDLQGDIWHFDGQAWQKLGTLGDSSCGATEAVSGIWGTENSVYAFSEHTLLRWNGTGFESLANWSCGANAEALSLRSVWGNSDQEVFFGLLDRGTSTACDGAVVMRFDGRQFHRM